MSINKKTKSSKKQGKEDYASTDTPAIKDELKIEGHIKGLSDFLMNCNTPLAIAIRGDWGTGKTSIMRQVEEYIKKNNTKVLNIWFDTWQFSQFSYDNQLPIILLSRLVSSLSNKSEISNKKNKYGKKLSNTFKNISNLIGVSGIDIIKHKSGFDLSRFTSKNKVDIFEQIEDIKKDFANLIGDITSEKNGYERIVIFIDDLDRLAPKRAVELLETLKLFLDVEKCVFVLAIDYDIIVRGVSDKYNFNMNNPKEREKGESFFDKIIQVSYAVPTGEYNFDNLINILLKDIVRIEKEIGKIGKKISKKDEEEAMEDIKVLLMSSVGENPRSVKRILNTFQLNRLIKNFDLEESKVLLGVICMNQAYPSVHSRFIQESRANYENTEKGSVIMEKAIEQIKPENNPDDSNLLLELKKPDIEEFLDKLLEVSEKISKESLEKIISASISTSDKTPEETNSRWDVFNNLDGLLENHQKKNKKSKDEIENMNSQATEILDEIRSLFEKLKEELNEEYKSSKMANRSTISLKRGANTSIADIQLHKETITIELPFGKSLSNNKEIIEILEFNNLVIPANKRLSLNINDFKLLEDNSKMKEFLKIITLIVKNK